MSSCHLSYDAELCFSLSRDQQIFCQLPQFGQGQVPAEDPDSIVMLSFDSIIDDEQKLSQDSGRLIV